MPFVYVMICITLCIKLLVILHNANIFPVFHQPQVMTLMGKQLADEEFESAMNSIDIDGR